MKILNDFIHCLIVKSDHMSSNVILVFPCIQLNSKLKSIPQEMKFFARNCKIKSIRDKIKRYDLN